MYVIIVQLTSAQKKDEPVCSGQDITKLFESFSKTEKDCREVHHVTEDDDKRYCLKACVWKKLGVVSK